MFGLSSSKRNLSDLSDKEMLALAIASEEEDSRIYLAYAERLRDPYPREADEFAQMAVVEREHCSSITEHFHTQFGLGIPPIQREDIYGFIRRTPHWLKPTIDIAIVREQAELMEVQAYNYYIKAAKLAQNPVTRALFLELSVAEREHQGIAAHMGAETAPLAQASVDAHPRDTDEVKQRLFLLQIVQPGLAGLMDGSVSTLAPLFAAAFATHSSWDAFLVGVAASIGAGISMGFAEALSDDGSLTGRGSPWIRGVSSGLMTVIGGLGHTFPFLIKDFMLATTLSIVIVLIELGVIAWIRSHYMDTPLLKAAFQVVIGGLLVFITGIVIGGAG